MRLHGTHRMQGRPLFYVLAFLLLLALALPLHAQENVQPEPVDPPIETTIPTVETASPTPVPSETPTEIVTETPPEVPPSETPTELPTETPTEIATEIPSDVPEETPSVTPDLTTPEATVIPLPLAYSANFDTGYPVELTPDTNWVKVRLDKGQGLQYADGAQDVFYTISTFTDINVEAKILLNNGEFRLIARQSLSGQYSAVLSSDGTLKLYKNTELINAGTITPTPGTWITFKLSAVSGTLSALIDGMVVMSATDLEPLPTGQGGFGATTGVLVRVDDFAIYGTPDGVPIIETPEKTIEPTAESTVEVTSEFTDKPIIEPTVEITSLPVNAASVTCAATPTYIRAASQNNGVQASSTIDGNNMDVSEDGRYVVFEMTDSTLVAGDVNNAVDIFRFDRENCTLSRVTVADGGGEPNGASHVEQISDDGRYVLFRSSATNLLPSPTSNAQIFLRDLNTGITSIVSVANSGTAGNDASFHASMSSDTRFVAFTSQASNLVAGDTNNFCDNNGDTVFTENCADVFMRDTAAGITQRFSTANGGGQSDGPVSLYASPLIDDTGTAVVFVSYATNLTPDGINTCTLNESGTSFCPEIYRSTGTNTERVSVADDEQTSNSNLYDLIMDMTADGRYVVFSSNASNLVANDNNAVADVFIRDTTLDTTTVVSLRNNSTLNDAPSGSASISENGDRVGFITASNTIMGDVGNSKTHLYVRSLSQNLTTRVSKTISGVMANDNITSGRIADGRNYAAFSSVATNLVSGDTNNLLDIFLTGIVFGQPPPLIPSDLVFISSTQTGITIKFTDNSADETQFRIERMVNTSWVQIGTVNAAAGSGTQATYTDTGMRCGQLAQYRVRAFRASDSLYSPYSPVLTASTTNCAPPPCNPNIPIVRISTGTNGVPQSLGESSNPNAAVSSDGHYIVYTSIGNNLAAGDNDFITDIFRYDRLNCQNQIASVSQFGANQNGPSSSPSISGDGRYVAFTSLATNVVGVDTNDVQDVFVQDMQTVTNKLASRNGTTQANQPSYEPYISSDGKFVVFTTAATNLSGLDSNGVTDIYLFNLTNNTLSLVSVALSGISAGNGSSARPFVVTIGNNPYVIFYSTASDLVNGDTNGVGDVFIRDVTGTATYRISLDSSENEANGNSRPSMAGYSNGAINVVFDSLATNLFPGDTAATCDADFNGSFTDNCSDVFLRTLPLASLNDGTTTLISRASGLSGPPAGATGVTSYGSFANSVSVDGRYVTFQSGASNLVTSDTNGKQDIFIRDTVLNTTSRLGNGNETSSNAAIAGYGQFVAFTSFASNLVTGDTNTFCDNNADTIFAENCSDVFLMPIASAIMGTPGKLTASTNLPSQVNLSWPAIPNVDSYQLWRDANNGMGVINFATTTNTTYTDTIIGMFCSNTATYFVRGFRTAGSQTTSFSAPAVGGSKPCASPTLTTPASGIQSQGGLTLQWNSVPYSGDHYDVLVTTDAAGLSPVSGYPVTIHAMTSYLVDPLPDGTYYWKVRAHNNNSLNESYGPYSAARSFIIDTTPLANAPTPLTPISNNPVNNARPTFTWTSVAGAAYYQIEINSDPTFTDPPEYLSPTPGSVGAITATSFTLPDSVEALLQGEYYWHVSAYDAALNVGAYSTESPRFIVNLLKLPASDAIIKLPGVAASVPVTFTWAAVTGAAGYRVQIDINNDGNFSDRNCAPVPMTALTCTLSGVQALTAAHYAWRVVILGKSIRPDHPARQFTVSPALPAAPQLVSPAANAVFSDNTGIPRSAIQFSWTSSAVGAVIEIDDSPTFNTTLEYVDTVSASGTTTLDLSLYPPGVYYWRVKGTNSLDVAGPPSVARPFVIDITPPSAAPAQLLPAVGAVINTVRPTFTYSTVTDPSGPVSYQIDLSTSLTPDFNSNIVTSLFSTTGIATMTSNLGAQGLYYWRVTALDNGNNSITSGNIRAFTMNISNLPAANTVQVAGNITFTWAAVPTATGYSVEIEAAGAPDFSPPDLTCPTNGSTTTTLSCTRALPAGNYVWRVVTTSAAQPVTNNNGIFRYLFVGTAAKLPVPTNVHLDAVSGTGSYDTDIYVNASEKTNGINLVWDAPAAVSNLSVDHYVIDFSPVTTFASITESLTSMTTSIAVPASMLALDGPNKYARVRAVYEPGTFSSANTASFWFVVDTIAPSQPALVFPAAGRSSKVIPKSTLKWSAATGNAPTNGYRLSVATNFGLTTPAITGSLDMPLTTTSYTFSTELPLGSLFWQVRAVDVAGNFSLASNGDFMAFLGTSPAQSAVNQSNRPTFTWQKLDGITQYTLQVARDGDTTFTGDVFEQNVTSSLPTVSFTYPAASPALSGIIYWRVYTQGTPPPAGYYASFAVTGGLTPPTLNPLTNGPVINAAEYPTTQLSWNAPVGTSFGVYNYHIEVAGNPAFTGAVEIGHFSASNATTLNLSPAMGAQPDGLKYWRVRAEYQPGYILGPYSATGTFTLDRTAPAKPAGLKVTFGTNPTRPTLSWSAVTGIAATNGYQIDLAEDSNFTIHVTGFPKSLTGTSTAISAPSALEQKTYYFVVRAFDAAGNASPDSDTFTFNVNVANLPANNAVVNAPTGTVNQVFSWYAIPGTNTYQLQVDTDGDGDFATGSPLTCSPVTSSALTCIISGLPRGTYLWRVVVNGNNPGTDIQRTLFVINGTSLPAPTNVLLSENGSIPPYYQDNYLCICEVISGANLEWTAPNVIGAVVVSYDVEYSNIPTFLTLLATDYGVISLSTPIPSTVTATDGIKYARVRARYQTAMGEQPGAFTAPKKFTVDTVRPDPVSTAITPLTGQIIATRTPTLSWKAVPGASLYEVVAFSISGPLILDSYVTTPRFVVPNALGLEDDIYLWSVYAYDIAGNSSHPAPDFFYFEVIGPQ